MKVIKVLWVCAGATEEANKAMFNKGGKSSGWVEGMLDAIRNNDYLDIYYIFPCESINEIIAFINESVTYYAFPCKTKLYKYDSKLIHQYDEIVSRINPDVIHIWGSERIFVKPLIDKYGKENCVIWIQGLVSIIEKHCMVGLPLNYFKYLTLKDIYRKNWFIAEQIKFYRRGIIEISMIQSVNHVIGRTTWDYACTKMINPNISYHSCNEILMPEFYDGKWDIMNIERHSIFISQASGPLKGLHFALAAFSEVLSLYPDAKLYVAGGDITDTSTIKKKLKLSGYGKYIKEIIKKNKLDEKVIFTGTLSVTQMKEQYLKSHVFVLPSTIENSSNSICEAKIMGVPIVASYVGGIMDLISNGCSGFLYQQDAPYMMAYYIKRIFDNDDLALRLSQNARSESLISQNKEKIVFNLLNIYKGIANNAKQ